jgi:hypothetical protein
MTDGRNGMGKNGVSLLHTLLADHWGVRATPAEPPTGAACVYMGCSRPGVPQVDGEVCCGFHGRYHGGPGETWRPLPSGKQIR